MALYFTSDTHFGHALVITTCKRPFASADEMDEALIERWNSVVKPGDTVFHLGDFAHRDAHNADRYLDRLNGEVHLIAGNHDGFTVEKHGGRFASVNQIKEITVEDRKIVLCHYPMREWNDSWQGSWHFYGHVHGKYKNAPLRHTFDVSSDANGLRPCGFAEIAAALTGAASV